MSGLYGGYYSLLIGKHGIKHVRETGPISNHSAASLGPSPYEQRRDLASIGVVRAKSYSAVCNQQIPVIIGVVSGVNVTARGRHQGRFAENSAESPRL